MIRSTSVCTIRQSGSDAVEPRFLDAVARAFEDAWHIEIDKFGWPAPPSDTLMGGSALYDVYLFDLIGTGENALGYTVAGIVRR